MPTETKDAPTNATLSNSQELKLHELKVDLSKREMQDGAAATAAGGITLINDTQSDVQCCLSNTVAGLASVGHAKAGETIVLPCAGIYWDVCIRYDNVAGIFIRFWVVGYSVFYNKMKGGITSEATVRVSQL